MQGLERLAKDSDVVRRAVEVQSKLIAAGVDVQLTELLRTGEVGSCESSVYKEPSQPSFCFLSCLCFGKWKSSNLVRERVNSEVISTGRRIPGIAPPQMNGQNGPDAWNV